MYLALVVLPIFIESWTYYIFNLINHKWVGQPKPKPALKFN